MNMAELLHWQWSDYAAKHQNKLNMLIHIIAVPLFWTAMFVLIRGFWLQGISALLLAVVLQGIGHKLEGESPEPMRGFGDFLRRFIAEQLITFPRYVLTGGWLKAVLK